ncbi:MAG: hypothetical protein AB8I08_13640 [Sandaracinaceae bacterium]
MPHRLPLIALATLALAACEPNVDREAVGGSEPSGVIDGTVLYVGQRPLCTFEDGRATGVEGRVVLLMFRDDNPPPPSGSATSAENLLLLNADRMFALSDCMPASPSAAELAEPITRSVAFTWPEIALAGAGLPDPSLGPPEVAYQIRGFFDRDEDFNPFFSVRRTATKGDVAGGAFVDTSVSPPQFSPIRFGNRASLPNGEVVSGVAVTLAARVNTEPPSFALASSTRALSSEATLPLVADPVAREQALFELSETAIELIDPREPSWALTLRAGGVTVDPHPSGYGFFTLPVDADRNGEQDLHPTLGTAGILWEHPIVLLRRARNVVELSVGVPDVVIPASVRPTQTLAQDTFSPRMDIVVPPIAAVNLDPTNPACTVPYIPAGTFAETYERIPVDCQEMPTGNYDVNVLSGIAGGRAIDYRAQLAADMPELPASVLETLVRARTDNDWVIEGGSYSSQAWSIPNELGCPDPYRPNGFDEGGEPVTLSQVDPNPRATCGEPASCDASGTLMQCSQGPAGRFAVVDPDGGNAPDGSDTSDGHGIAGCQTTVRAETMVPDAVTYMPVPDACCEAVSHLCGLPLCSLRDGAVRADTDGGRQLREIAIPGQDFDVDEDGRLVPRCVPFLMPASCCR